MRCVALAVLLIGVFAFAVAEEAATTTESETTTSTEVSRDADGFTQAELDTMKQGEEVVEFKAEVTRLMDIIIHSLYSNREVFLRELISNSADAIDKIRYQALTNKALLGTGDDADLNIKIKFDKESRILSITDKGIGMTRSDLVKNLGVVAKSGTSDFIEAAMSGQDSLSLIGQFGVGFYSVYLVSDNVTVVSKHNDDKQHIWRSAADKTFTVTVDPRGNTLGRGTQVILHLKEDATQFLDENELEKLVNRYSSFISFPIYIWNEKSVTREEPVEEEPKEEKEGEDDLEIKDDEDSTKPKTKTVTEKVWDWKLLNTAKAIWTRSPSDITEDEYDEFYKTLTKDTKGSLAHIHFSAEGEIQFKSILFIPSKVEPGHYDKFYEKSTALKLYVRRVLIADSFDDFLPRYLSFIKGVVDSEDLPLNVNRETLAQNRVLKVMSKKITRKALEMLRKLADGTDEDDESTKTGDEEKKEEEEDKKEEHSTEKYSQFWENFGKSIKLGLIDDKANKHRLARLLRYKSSKSGDKWTSLDEYVERMKEDQKNIYYITGESLEEVKKSPFLEKLVKNDLEVLYMVEPLDEYVVTTLTDYESNALMAVHKENLKIGEENKDYEKKVKAKYEKFTTWLKNVYGDKVEKVVVSKRLAETPCILVTSQYGWSANMERIMKAQTFTDAQRRQVMVSKKIMEINPYHPMVHALQLKSEESPDDASNVDLADLLYDAALVQSGFPVPDSAVFAKRIHRLIASSVNVAADAEMLPEDVFPDEESTDSASSDSSSSSSSEDADDDDDSKVEL